VRRLLARLAACRGLDVTIISGRVASELEAWLGEYPVGLIAEHGDALRRRGHPEWERLDRGDTLAWMEPVAKVLHLYEESTPGSFVEQKRTSLVWHYRRVDPEFGGWKARQLAHELGAMLANQPVIVRHGRKIVEVTDVHINKGAAVARALEEDRDYALVVCAGDDTTDESMFQLNLPGLVSIKVGEGETRAQLTLATPATFRRFVEDVVAAAEENCR
jgi:trehalose 6-phosphate synthase/phosphatase